MLASPLNSDIRRTVFSVKFSVMMEAIDESGGGDGRFASVGGGGKYEGKNNKKLTAKKFLVKRIYAPTYECSPPQLNLRCRLRRRRRGVRQRAESKTQNEPKSHFSLFLSKKKRLRACRMSATITKVPSAECKGSNSR